jgi:NAD(P)-dependent dehydrogenase (short-subunit alcohol dehydrogenase family)
MTTPPPVALVVGAGDATGGAVARRFAREGYAVCVTRRSADKLQPLKAQIEADGGVCHAFGSDARKEDALVALRMVTRAAPERRRATPRHTSLI